MIKIERIEFRGYPIQKNIIRKMFINFLLMCITYSEINALSDISNQSSNYERNVLISNYPEDCIFVTSQTGYFTYKSTSNSSVVCGIYLMTESQNLIEITFTEFDVPCDMENPTRSLVQYVDGWELNGEVFPSISEATYSAEENEFCSSNNPIQRIFVSSQNGAQLSYRIPEIGKGFTILVRHKKHPSPCNVIHIDEPYYILQNQERNIDCAIWTPYPTIFQFNSYSVGYPKLTENPIVQCSYVEDRIEIGGGNGLDTSHFEVLKSICNQANSQGEREELIDCSSITIKLVSSGNYKNYLNLSVYTVSSDDNLDTNYRCNSLK